MEEMSYEDNLRNDLYKLATQQQWEEVMRIYKENPGAHILMLSKSTVTAFHIAISSYNPNSPNLTHERCTMKMFSFMKEWGQVSELLRLPNLRGDTLLHLAAAVGWEAMCIQIASQDPELIEIRNSNGETPLFISAQHGNLQTFVALHGIYNHGKDKVDESLCRRNLDGNTVLHSAISGEYFRLAYFILGHYKNLLNYVNIDGETPLHVLARKPNLFKSSSQLRFYESIIYHCVCSRPKIKNLPSTNDQRKDYDSYSSNSTTCISILKFATRVLSSLGVGLSTIRKVQEMRVGHSHVMQMLDKMIEFEPSYKYDSNGQRPSHLPEAFGDIPNQPPNVEEPQTAENYSYNIYQQQTIINDDDEVKGTPLLEAAKMGILEMVKQILNAVPVAINDRDSDGKNVLMVAAENRQIAVFDYLIQRKLPEYVFHDLDYQRNSVLHSAAILRHDQTWSIPGAALQMQWEITWFKHVTKSIPPQTCRNQNAEGETPSQIFTRTHSSLVKSGKEWLTKTSEFCTVVAALIATVAFATSGTVPGGFHQTYGYPILKDEPAFKIYSIASLAALSLSIATLFSFFSIVISRFEERDFERDLPRKLLVGLTCLILSKAAMLVSFYAGHSFILVDKLRVSATPIYVAASLPIMLFVMAKNIDLVLVYYRILMGRSYKVFPH
ncbi:ankyrin repeat-containing protein ITN1-like [Salvia hispanica]|uniref:ankyrin repeat-containing protein ITN1-like n=1 Tax=Salvia hispanica TaxID=49212 RepID=UPI002009B077|nr:ankyrin repeat-containing protein ITN1-like [Salvia hispanica]